MKKIINKIALLSIITATFFGCSDADNTVYDVFDGQTYGAVLRKIQIYNQNYNLTDTSSFFGIEIEEQDEQYGKLLSEVNVYTNYTDNTNDGVNSVTEKLVRTIAASEFTTSSRDLPTTDIYVTLAEALTAVGDPAFNVGDSFTIRLELILTDGRIFSAADTSGSLQGSYFSSPYAYTVPILCAPKPGVYTVDMHDSYGDGWQTNSDGEGIKVVLTAADGTISTLEVGMCSPYGSAAGTFSDESLGGCTGPASTSFYDASGTVTIPEGMTLAVWEFPGDEYAEISFEIYAPDGTLLLAAGEGEAPAGVLEVLNCL